MVLSQILESCKQKSREIRNIDREFTEHLNFNFKNKVIFAKVCLAMKMKQTFKKHFGL